MISKLGKTTSFLIKIWPGEKFLFQSLKRCEVFDSKSDFLIYFSGAVKNLANIKKDCAEFKLLFAS